MEHALPCRMLCQLALALLLGTMGSAVSVIAEDLFYKYDNAEGVTVIDDHIPPRYAPNGYVILNRAGRVIEVVPRALTEEERRADSSAMQARLRAEEAERQKRYDEALLARYSSVADIEDLKRRRVNEVQVRINMQRGAIAQLKQQLEKEQGQAAELEMSGQTVPEMIENHIKELRTMIADEEARIVRMEGDRSTIEARYQFDIERFRIIRPDAP